MNIKLINCIVSIIDSLTPEERELLESRIRLTNSLETNVYHQEKSEKKIPLKREEKPFYPPIEDYINITRDERISQQDEIINDYFKKRK